MSGLSPALAAQLQEVIDRWGVNQAQFSDWLAGTVGGGPNGDGRYPLTNAQGVEVSVACPASIMDMVEGPAAQAQVAKLAAQTAASAAAASASNTDAAKVLAEAAKTAAVAARNLAQTAQSNASNHEANARYWAELAVGKGGEITVMVQTVTDLAQQVAVDAVAAEANAESAAVSAGLAATFEPNNFDLKSDAIAANRISGTLSLSNIPVLPSQIQIASAGGLNNLSPAQQAQIGQGSIVTTTDGGRWVYKGSGSKTADASYIMLADVTPDWNQIVNVPTTFLPSAHSHTHTDINGFTWANLGSKPLTFTPSAHGHDWSEISGKPSSFAPSTHGHDWSEISGKPSLAMQNQAANFSNVTVTAALIGGHSPWTAGNFNPADKADATHSHDWAQVTGKPNIALNYADVLFNSVQAVQSSSPTVGRVYLGNQAGGARYIIYNGSAYDLPGANLIVNGGTVWTSSTFNPASKADASAWNSNTTAANISATKGFISGVNSSSTIANQSGAAALEARANDASAGAAFMQFHRPGVFATNFGLDTDSRLKIGGWSYGAVSDHIWHSGNIPNDKWQTSVDGQNRFYFSTDGRTYLGAYNNQGWSFRNNANGADAFTVSTGGAGNFASSLVAQGGLYTNGNEVSIRGGSPTIYFRDTDQRSAMIHVNSNTFHILRGSGSDTSSWETVNGRWPLTINLENNDASFGGQVEAATHVRATANVYAAGEVYAGNWFRVQAACGLYWEQYGGGWHMSDATYLRVYNSKYLYSAGSAGFDGNVNMGSFAVLSDARLKTEIAPLVGHGWLIDRLEVKSYLKGGKREWGVIAQDVEKVEPMLVIRAGDPSGEWGDEPLRTVDANSLMFAMLAELKDLRARVASLESRK